MSVENVNYMRSIIKAVPAESKDGYIQALKDILLVSEAVPYGGTYIDSELRGMVRDMAKAANVPVPGGLVG